MPQGKIMEIPQLRAICNDLAVGKSYSRIKELRKVAKSTLQNIKSRRLACGKLEPAALNGSMMRCLLRSCTETKLN